eukprot:TRINITY_DN40987_c0_g1_i1.p1 TRINITY_DN40987_c0_g1~~TRINITY_DN40987_c0_g1_i1.p1  ORF type:complete len:127 (+),score=47.62 TRINITY_DN40987_c0_g1_i1:79-459(+)
MPIVARDPTDEEKELICKACKDGKVDLPDKEGTYRIDYGVSLESRVTGDASFKKRIEKVTCSCGEDVVYFTVVNEAKGQDGEKAELPDALAEPVPRKPCVFFNKGTCKNGLECTFSHNYIAPRVRK